MVVICYQIERSTKYKGHLRKKERKKRTLRVIRMPQVDILSINLNSLES